MRLILYNILSSGNVPDMHHPLVVTAGQVCPEVLVPGEAAELGACDQLLTGSMALSIWAGHHSAVVVHADAFGHPCCCKDLQQTWAGSK